MSHFHKSLSPHLHGFHQWLCCLYFPQSGISTYWSPHFRGRVKTRSTHRQNHHLLRRRLHPESLCSCLARFHQRTTTCPVMPVEVALFLMHWLEWYWFQRTREWFQPWNISYNERWFAYWSSLIFTFITLFALKAFPEGSRFYGTNVSKVRASSKTSEMGLFQSMFPQQEPVSIKSTGPIQINKRTYIT